MAAVDCQIRFGIAATSSPAAWAGGGGNRNVADWLPRIDEKVIDPRTNCFTPRWYNYLRALGDRLGGINGLSIPQVSDALVSTQAQVAETTSYAVQVSDYATQIATTATTTAAVTQSASLPGSTSIPDTGDPPPRPGTQPR